MAATIAQDKKDVALVAETTPPQPSASVFPPAKKTPKPRCDRKPTRQQASEIQAFLHEHIMKLKKKVDCNEKLGEEVRDEANALSNLVRAWDTAADRARIARGKPLPGSNRPVGKPKRAPAPPESPQPVVPCVVAEQPPEPPNIPPVQPATDTQVAGAQREA